ncbi:MAG: hypothetical protein U5J62_02595 [Desulfurivibrio sp.]|nr:hypothetical protein [Desulfurivibrio sp.]
MKQLKRWLWLAALLVLLSALPALAHKVNLFAYVEGGTIYTESYFPDGRPVVGGKVLVFDSEDHKLLTGDTDQEGRFHFRIPKVDELRLVIKATMGHQNQFILQKAEVESGQ